MYLDVRSKWVGEADNRKLLLLFEYEVFSVQVFLIWVICVFALKGFGIQTLSKQIQLLDTDRTIVYQHSAYKY